MDTYVLMMLVCIGLVVGVFVDDARKVRRARKQRVHLWAMGSGPK